MPMLGSFTSYNLRAKVHCSSLMRARYHDDVIRFVFNIDIKMSLILLDDLFPECTYNLDVHNSRLRKNTDSAYVQRDHKNATIRCPPPPPPLQAEVARTQCLRR